MPANRLPRLPGARYDAGRSILIFLALLLALWLPRGFALDRFVTVDEPKWLLRSANFYNALAHGNFKDTFQKEHPGVTITWAGSAGFLWRFPGYSKISPEGNMTPTRFHTFLQSHGRSSLELLVAGRTFVLFGIVVALALSYVIAARLLGALAASLAFLLIAFDPFSISLSRMLHLDGLLSALMLLSILAFVTYLFLNRQTGYLLISAVAAGLAWLTKSPAFFLAPFFGLLLLIEWLQSGWRTPSRDLFRRRHLWQAFSPFLLWFAVAWLIFILLWPAMWVDPVGSLTSVFSQATAYASEGHEIPSYFYGETQLGGISSWYFYPLVYLWRITPFILVGLVFVLLALLFPKVFPLENTRLILVLLLFTGLFTIFMSLGAKKFDRYLLPIFAPLDLIAALGWLALLKAANRYAKRLSTISRRLAGGLLLGIVLLGQLWSVIQSFPYYLNYFNPILGGSKAATQVMMVGWGEGLDQAARYLNSLPQTGKERAISWYGDGCFSYFYDGVTVPIGLDFTFHDLRKTDIVVLYLNQWQRGLPSPEFMAYFEQLTPDHVVRINNLEYVRVYNLRNAPEMPILTPGE